MSDRGWLQYLGLVGCLILFLMLPASWLLAYQQDHEEERRDAASYSVEAGSELFAHCAGRAEPDAFVCVAKAQEADREDRERQHDLKAQQDVAEWTAAGAILAGLGLIVTAAGLFYLARTLDETRRSTAVAREIGQKQIRAYLSFGRAEVMHEEFVSGEKVIPHLRFRFRVHNAGQSPARDLQLNIECTISIAEHREVERRSSVGFSDVASGKKQWAPIFINYNDGLESPIFALPEMLDVTMATLHVAVWATGVDVFGQPLDPTPGAYAFRVTQFHNDTWFRMDRITSQLFSEEDYERLQGERAQRA